jgi:hypothetical protein
MHVQSFNKLRQSSYSYKFKQSQQLESGNISWYDIVKRKNRKEIENEGPKENVVLGYFFCIFNFLTVISKDGGAKSNHYV